MRKFYPVILGLLMAGISVGAWGQSSGFWTPVQESTVKQDLFQGRQRPATYRIFKLDEALFRSAAATAPSEKNMKATSSPLVVSFPGNNGELISFRVVDAPVMDPALAARYPGIRSYAGTSISDPSVTVRFDVTPAGVHGMILSPTEQTVYIDPAGLRADALYRVVGRNDLPAAAGEFKCATPGSSMQTAGTGRPGSADDGTLRTYRLALCSSFDFSQFFFDGTETSDAQRKAKVLAAQVTHVTRANAIFERDFAVRLILVANNDAVIAVSAADDPWASGNRNTITQQVCDARIGNDFYDIGHLEDRDFNDGNAGAIGSVCRPGVKGSAYTAYSDPAQVEYFVVDYLTHEMGHQMGANHTFSFSYENTIAQVEPGSGSTIMGYAGITSADVQPHSDDYFHSISIQQVTDYLYDGPGAACAVAIPTANSAPIVNAGADYIIPFSTPFKLAGTATDTNGDALTYNWEQNNRMSASQPQFPSTTTGGPAFRSFRPTADNTRTFPALASILNGSNTNTWEKLPSITRSMNFRLTARDNRAGGGANSFDEMVVQVTGTTGPFRVLTGNSALTIEEDTYQTITWNVAGSNGAPVNCAAVNILLSRDGGLTFPVTLAAATANDGSESVLVPEGGTTSARIKIESVGNIFFDINDQNITISASTFGFRFSSPANNTVACDLPASTSFTLNTTALAGYNSPITLSASSKPAGTNVTFSPATITPGGTTTVTVTGVNTLSPGTYDVTVVGTTADIVRSRILFFTVSPGAGPVITTSPQPVVACQGTSATFNVTATGALSYQWRVRTTPTGAFVALPGETASSLTIASVTSAQSGYAYDVVITGKCGVSTSSAASLTVNLPPSITTQPASTTLCLGSTATFSVAATGGSLTYLWQVSTDGTNYTAAPGVNNGANYSLSNIQTSNNNNRFRVVVSGPCAPAATSNAAVLTVVNPAAVAAQGNPVPQVICETGTVTYTVTAAATGTLFQWQVSTNGGATYTNITDGGPYAGTTTSTLTISNIPASFNNNLYRVALYNVTCTAPVYSTGALLTVNARPTVTLAAAPLTSLLPGQSTTLTATINPSATGFNISWYKDDVLIPGVTGTTYVVDSVAVGNYKVRIVNQVTGCNNESAPLTITTSASSRLFVFPSPNNGQFTVSYYNSTGAAGKQTLAVFDSRGARIYTALINVSGPYTLNNINIRGVATGVYYVVIGDANGKKITDTRILIR